MNWIKKILDFIASIPKDKLLHDYAGLLIAMFVFAISYRFCPVWLCFVLSNILSVAALGLKELYDAHHEGTVEFADFLWGIFGVVKFDLAMLIMFV